MCTIWFCISVLINVLRFPRAVTKEYIKVIPFNSVCIEVLIYMIIRNRAVKGPKSIFEMYETGYEKIESSKIENRLQDVFSVFNYFSNFP